MWDKAWMPILCSIDNAFKSFGLPSVPSLLTNILGTKNKEIPLILGGASG